MRLSNFSYRRRLDQLIQLYIRLSYTGLLKTATVLFVFYPKCQTEGKCEVFLTEIDPFSRQSFTLGFISKQNLSALKLARMAYFFHVVVICQEFYFFLSLTVFKLLGYFTPDHGCSVRNSKLNWVENVQIITS